MATLTLEHLQRTIADGQFALARITTTYQPGGGPGSKVYPPTFPPPTKGDPGIYLFESRAVDGDERKAVVLDQVPSQANRAEEALLRLWEDGTIKMPMLRLTHHGAADAVITSLTAPHRVFDAYWRDSRLADDEFKETEVGKSVLAAKLDDAGALLQHDPGSLVYGAWNSYRGGRGEKFPRVYSSEIVGWDPVEGSRKAGRLDPLNIVGSKAGTWSGWTYSASGVKGEDSKLSKIGHGNIAPTKTHGGVTISSASRFATLSLTALGRVGFGSAGRDQQLAARTYLAALALLGDRLAFGSSGLWLRSGCDLVVLAETLEWIGRGGVVEGFELSRNDAVDLYQAALESAQGAGWALELTPIDLEPTRELSKAIDFSLTKAESTGE